MPVILATQEAELRKIVAESKPRQIVCEILSQKKKKRRKKILHKKGLVEWFKVSRCRP
jgi:hypothetical protein